MGNLDFLEKKPRIAYTLSWDGVTEGKVTNTTGTRKVYKISSEEFVPRPDIVWTPTGSSGRPCNTPENIRLEKNYRFRNIEGSSNVSVSVLKENTNIAGYYRFDLFFGNEGEKYVELFYVLVTNKEIISGDFGNANPTFSEIGWYFGGASNAESGDIMSVLKDPLVQFSYSGKGFTSPKKYYSELSNSIDADTYYTLWIDHTVIEAASGKEDDYNAICIPGDWNSKADIQLDEKLAKLLKAMSYNKVTAIIKYAEAVSKKTPENLGQIKTQQYITAWTVNKNQLNVYYGNDIIFRQTYDVNEHTEWYAKYFSNTP
mgnify:CR=1 FL=1